MQYKLLALDLDGTFLNDAESISHSNLSSVQKASKEGVKIIITTGRSYNSAKRFIRMVNVPDPTITFNGAVIINSGEVLRKITLHNELIQDLIKLLKDMDYCPIVYTADGQKYYETFGKYTEDFLSFSKGFEKELKKLSHLLDRKWDNVIRLSVIAGKYDVPLLHAELKKRFGQTIRTIDTFFSGWNFWIFEILDKLCSKSNGLQFLCEKYGFSRKEVIAVGDNNNDLDMINWAGLGVAMRNGMDSVLREADYVTEYTNNEDGVTEVIQKFILMGTS
jgi:Cof subfamily protein (haloacid dehalogenase superfamily)